MYYVYILYKLIHLLLWHLAACVSPAKKWQCELHEDAASCEDPTGDGINRCVAMKIMKIMYV